MKDAMGKLYQKFLWVIGAAAAPWGIIVGFYFGQKGKTADKTTLEIAKDIIIEK